MEKIAPTIRCKIKLCLYKLHYMYNLRWWITVGSTATCACVFSDAVLEPDLSDRLPAERQRAMASRCTPCVGWFDFSQPVTNCVDVVSHFMASSAHLIVFVCSQTPSISSYQGHCLKKHCVRACFSTGSAGWKAEMWKDRLDVGRTEERRREARRMERSDNSCERTVYTACLPRTPSFANKHTKTLYAHSVPCNTHA